MKVRAKFHDEVNVIHIGETYVCLVAQSCPTLCDHMDCSPPGSSVHGDSPGEYTGMGCYALLQGIILTQGFNTCLLHCRWILYQLSHLGSPPVSPKILEWVAHSFSRGSSQPRVQTCVSYVSCIGRVSCTAWVHIPALPTSSKIISSQLYTFVSSPKK